MSLYRPKTLYPLTEAPTSRELVDAQNRINDVLGDVVGREVLGGRLLEDIELTGASVNLIAHRLGREITGYIVTRRSADCRIWDDMTTTQDLSVFVPLNTSAAVTVSLWVF